MKILVADNNVVFRNVLKAMLEQWGYDVAVARTGDEAWRLLDGEDAPRLAILDWVMPGLDGIEVCRRVRARTCKAYTYIMIVASRQTWTDPSQALHAGADDCVRKPVRSAILRDRLAVGERIVQSHDRPEIVN